MSMTTGRTLVLVAALLLAGCGSDDESSDRSGSAGTNDVIEIVETDFALDPETVMVEKAGEVTFRISNDGATTHALEIEGDGLEEESDAIAPGDSADLTVAVEAGEYELYCPIGNHREQGMEGTVEVGAGVEGATTGETETEEDSGYGG